MFDIQMKRIHEYKRQLLNILGIVYRYKKIKEMTATERKDKFTPQVCIFGGKAFATYAQAKTIVKLITAVGVTVNNDPDIGDLLKPATPHIFYLSIARFTWVCCVDYDTMAGKLQMYICQRLCTDGLKVEHAHTPNLENAS